MMYKTAIVLTVLSLSTTVSGNLHDRIYYEAKFFEWLREHSLLIQTGTHFVKFLQNFADNHDIIENHNAGNYSYSLGKCLCFLPFSLFLPLTSC
jgi:hypothetical protein